LDKATSLTDVVATLWNSNQHFDSIQWLIRIREILNELLNGVTDREMDLSRQISDLYIFLINMLTRVETSRDPKQLGELRELLAMERDTWLQFVNLEQASRNGNQLTQSPPHTSPSPHMPFLGGYNDPSTYTSSDGFSLDA
jgi:flagellin-specific chaperone FliS